MLFRSGEPSPAMVRRTDHGVKLVQSGFASVLMVTGGKGAHAPAEAQVMKKLAISRGIPANLIITENKASSTFESARFCCNIIRKRKWKKIVLVTDSYHLPRAKLAFRFFGATARGSAPGYEEGKTRVAGNSYYIFREIFAIAWYLLKFAELKLRGNFRESD